MMITKRTYSLTSMAGIVKILACPKCGGTMKIRQPDIACLVCGAIYPICDGVLLLACMGSVGGTPEEHVTASTSERYQKKYQEIQKATLYNEAYEKKLLKRMSTRRECQLLRRLLSGQEHCRVLLDLPCGGGRLSPQISAFTDLIIEADIAKGQVLYGMRTSSVSVPQVWMTASALHIPLQDNTVDGVVCARLCHHLPTQAERERLVTELLRVSRRFVVVSFFAPFSIMDFLRRVRRPFNRTPVKLTMTIKRLRELARENGAELIECPPLDLARFSSGHRYALIKKNQR
jgi:ubiquinone/menaquinone biosynthesis C-methylase UbiE